MLKLVNGKAAQKVTIMMMTSWKDKVPVLEISYKNAKKAGHEAVDVGNGLINHLRPMVQQMRGPARKHEQIGAVRLAARRFRGDVLG